MNASDFEKKLSDIERSFDEFSRQFQSGDATDFAPIYKQVTAFLEDFKSEKVPPQCLQKLQSLSQKIEKITQKGQAEMKVLQTEISETQHRSQGHIAYKRQKIMGGY